MSNTEEGRNWELIAYFTIRKDENRGRDVLRSGFVDTVEDGVDLGPTHVCVHILNVVNLL